MAGYDHKPLKALDRRLEGDSKKTVGSHVVPTMSSYYQKRHEARIKKERLRVQSDLAAMAGDYTEGERRLRGTLQGDSLKCCHFCRTETVEVYGVLRRMGWLLFRRCGAMRWCCSACKKSGKHKETDNG
jgi:hypothetical protein